MRSLPASVLGACLLAGCATPGGTSDFAWALSPGYGPGPALGLALEQRVLEEEHMVVDVVLGLSLHALDEAPDGRDDGFGAHAGLRAHFRTPGATAAEDWVPWVGLGATWLRARGEPARLDEPGDYGGVVIALGLRRRLGPHFSIGPRVELLLLDAEGAGSSGQIPRAALDLVWHP